MMNILPFLHFFAFLVYCYLIIVILIKGPKSWLNRSCAAFFACLALWSFTYIFIQNLDTLKDTAILFDNIGSIGWLSFASFFLWFSLIFTEKKKILKTKIVYPLLFILPLLFIYKQWTGFFSANYIIRPWGWEATGTNSMWWYYYLYYLSFIIISLYLILNFRRKTKDTIKKKQAGIIFVTTLITLILATITDAILPELNISVIPTMGDLITLIWAGGLIYAIAKYKLMVITPAAAAENIISTMADSLILLDREGNIATVNKATLDLSGYGEDELTGKSVEMLFTEKDFKSTLLDKAIKKEAIRNHELGFKTKTKDIVPTLFSSSTMMDEAGGMAGIVCIIKDITERKKADKTLAESEESYRTVFENTGTATVVIEEDTTGSMVNTQFEKLSGYSKEEIENKMKWTDFIIPEDLEKMKKYHINRRNAGAKAPTEYEFRMMDKKGNIKDIFMKIDMMPNTKKSVASLTDITERKQAEEEIRLHAAIMDNVAEGICLIGLDDLLIKWTNEKFVRMFGYDPGEMIGKSVNIINAPIRRTPTDETGTSIADVLRETGEWHGEVRNIKRDGTHFWCYANVSTFDHPEYGKVEVSVNTDITERKLAEEEIKLINIQLKERIKELSCLFKLSQLIEKPGISLEEIVQELVNFLPAAWQYSEITCARIILGKKEYKTENFKETIWKQSRDIKAYNKLVGTVEVYYLEEKLEIDEGPFLREERDLITIITERLGEFIDRKNSTEQLQQSYQRTKRAMDATIETISKTVEAKDPYTAGHQQRVSQLATAIAKELNFSKDKIEGIRIASLIHDIGKIGLPTEILSKPTKLSDIEFSLIKEHSQIGYNILKSIDFSYPVAQIVLQHHERLNGSGYPLGLKGKDILPETKIIALADVVEAMSSYRPYRPALGIDKALEEISQNKDILYDPEVVDACLKLFKEKKFKFE